MGKARQLNNSGQAMLFVAIATTLVSVMAVLSATHFGTSAVNFGSYYNQQQTFYVAEGILNIASSDLADYASSGNQITNSAMSSYLLAQLNAPGIVPPNYQLNSATVTIMGAANQSEVIPTGPFSGMQANMNTVNLKINLSSSLAIASANLNVIMTLGGIFPFQFLYFVDLPWGGFRTAPGTYYGRIHINGDACLGGWNGGNYLYKVTASGHLLGMNDPSCLYVDGITSNTLIANDSTFSTFTLFDQNNDNNCANCAGSGLSWIPYAQKTWSGNVQDVAMGVPKLTLPGSSSSANAQYGVNGNSLSSVSNTGNGRFLVDPPVAGDSAQVAKEKYSNNADIRIIDGVWYINAPGSSWPGIAIWSDHPGSYSGVGQDDIRTYWAGHGNTWSALGPTGYSYYSYNDANQALNSGVYGVVSYGSLGTGSAFGASTPANMTLIPSGFIDTTQAGGTLCTGGYSCSFTGLLPAASTANPCGGAPLSCTGPASNISWSSHVLNATRAGFLDPQVYSGTLVNQTGKSHIFPVNFDVGLFQQALQNVSAGELGSYFGGATSIMTHPFNGIIYISATWPGSLTNFGTGQPTLFPFQGFPNAGVVDAGQDPSFYTNKQQQALPFPLCSTSLAGNKFDTVTPPDISHFTIPLCSKYGTGAGNISAYPNAVRLINGSNLGYFGQGTGTGTGISIVSNLPVYITGDYNSLSNVSSATALPWTSSLVAGDHIAILSDNWTENSAPWDPTPMTILNQGNTIRKGANTTINTAMYGGFASAKTSERFQEVPAIEENWTGFNLNEAMSVVIPFYPVYQQAYSPTGFVYTFEPPNRTVIYDPHFGYSSNQPPGSVVYPISAISRWSNN